MPIGIGLCAAIGELATALDIEHDTREMSAPALTATSDDEDGDDDAPQLDLVKLRNIVQGIKYLTFGAVDDPGIVLEVVHREAGGLAVSMISEGEGAEREVTAASRHLPGRLRGGLSREPVRLVRPELLAASKRPHGRVCVMKDLRNKSNNVHALSHGKIDVGALLAMIPDEEWERILEHPPQTLEELLAYARQRLEGLKARR